MPRCVRTQGVSTRLRALALAAAMPLAAAAQSGAVLPPQIVAPVAAMPITMPSITERAAPERVLTLDQAQQAALESNPDFQSIQRSIEAAEAGLREARASYFPQINGALTAVGAKATGYGDGKTGADALEPRITAGALNEPTVEDRAAAGVSVSQLLTDFGRTSNLVDSAHARLRSARDAVEDRRQLLLLLVTQQYMQALEAQGTLKVAQQTLQDRMTFLDRISLLQKNKLKSDLDVSFAAVEVDQARLLIVQTKAAVETTVAALESTIGLSDGVTLTLIDPQAQLPTPMPLGVLLDTALARRPELQRLRDDLIAAQKYASAQHKLQAPTLSAIGAAGVTPIGDANLPQDYAAGGVNLSIPIYQGGRLQAQYDQARIRADQAADAVRSAELMVRRDVRSAWLSADASFRAIEVSDHLQASAQNALELAQSRYRLGVSSIVELNRAQLNAVDAEIGEVRARYEYRIALAHLAYRAGTLTSCSQLQDFCR